MTKEELLARLGECLAKNPAVGHHEADQLLLAYIGDEDIRAAFDALTKWYE